MSDELKTKIIINVIIFFVIVIGLFRFIGKTYGWFNEGGLIYEWWKNKKIARKNKKNNNK